MFTGKQYDRDVQLYYFGARWYSPEIGKFITVDPIQDGTNWYAYCYNNPLRFIDPSGLKVYSADDETHFSLFAPNVHFKTAEEAQKFDDVMHETISKMSEEERLEYFEAKIHQKVQGFGADTLKGAYKYWNALNFNNASTFLFSWNYNVEGFNSTFAPFWQKECA